MSSGVRVQVPTHLVTRSMVGLKRLFNLGLIAALQAVHATQCESTRSRGRQNASRSLSCLSLQPHPDRVVDHLADAIASILFFQRRDRARHPLLLHRASQQQLCESTITEL
jgi:hypothetical protein